MVENKDHQSHYQFRLTHEYHWMDKVQNHYQMLRDQFIRQIEISLTKPEATYFAFFSIEKMLNGRTYDDIINRCFKEGVSVAPGLDFGKDFGLYLRICFTGESPDRLKKGTDRLRKVLLEK